MDLKSYFFGLGAPERDQFVAQCGTSKGHVHNVAYGYREPSGEMAVAMERASAGAVTCEEVAPGSPWRRIPDKAWPNPKGRPVLDYAMRERVKEAA